MTTYDDRASLTDPYSERGFSVRLLTDTGNSVPGEGADGFAGASQGTADAAGRRRTPSR
ncbi:hypothetical protein SALBM311S_02229 [Streptomyces alboniger]